MIKIRTYPNMPKKISQSKYFSWFLDAVGIFSLASFLMLGFFLRFIVDIHPSCYFTDALIVYVECGKSFVNEFLKFYFQFFSLLLIWIIIFVGHGLFVSIVTLDIQDFSSSLFLLCIVLFTITSSIRILYRISKRVLWDRSIYSLKEKNIALILSLVTLLPSIFILSVKYYKEPPKVSNRAVVIDMWHSELSFPRSHLQDWSLIDIKRPLKEPKGTLDHPIHSRRKVTPFANLYISPKEINPSLIDDEKISIRLVPHYNVMNEKALFQKREDYLKEKLEKEYSKKIGNHKFDNMAKRVQKPLYSSAKQIENWELYKPAIDSNGHEPDIFVHRNSKNKIENIVECTSKNYCVVNQRIKKCNNSQDCLNCNRICKDVSFGTSKLHVNYQFSKEHLNSYFERHQKILNFIENHSTIPP